MTRLSVIIAALVGIAGLAAALERPDGYGAAVDFRIIGPPPAPGSAEAVAERAAYDRTPVGTPGWKAAEGQIYALSDRVTAALGCAAGRRLSGEATPLTIRLLAHANSDLHTPVEAAKAHWRRDRPFVGAANPATCDPRSLGNLGASTGGAINYSYPSGHAAYGELWARILSAALPARAAEITAFGRAIGDNRIACRVHWPSDVAAGRRLADAVFDRLMTLPGFQADLAAAKAELAKAPAVKC